MNCDIMSKSTIFRKPSSETLPPKLWDFYSTRSHEFGSCLVTNSSAMEALGSPSISRAPMGGAMLSEYRKLVYADDRYNDNILSFAYLCRSVLWLSREKSVKSMCYLTIYIKVHLTHKTNHIQLVNRRRMDRNKIRSGGKIQNGCDRKIL